VQLSLGVDNIVVGKHIVARLVASIDGLVADFEAYDIAVSRILEISESEHQFDGGKHRNVGSSCGP